MPRQETFLSVQNDDELLEIVKTYDESFAREAFRNMDEDALARLAESLKFESLYEPEGIPKPQDDGYEEFVWDVMVEEAREEYNTFSYFIVTKTVGGRSEELFVSPDWPTAEAYVKKMQVSEPPKA
ncbi:MAG TPA: hypothetical protein VGU25_07955 [Acidobacteriaceae bacterium]|nr:hypothetical protein [Acidobacteriaceae bacterium]